MVNGSGAVRLLHNDGQAHFFSRELDRALVGLDRTPPCHHDDRQCAAVDLPGLLVAAEWFFRAL